MKKNFLIIAILAGLVVSASAAYPDQTHPEIYVLPAYVVTAPRYQPAELAVIARLKELQQGTAARQTALPAPYLPDLKPAQAAAPMRVAQLPPVRNNPKS
jgi:hypothetical protein